MLSIIFPFKDWFVILFAKLCLNSYGTRVNQYCESNVTRGQGKQKMVREKSGNFMRGNCWTPWLGWTSLSCGMVGCCRSILFLPILVIKSIRILNHYPFLWNISIWQYEPNLLVLQSFYHFRNLSCPNLMIIVYQRRNQRLPRKMGWSHW